MNLKAYFFPSDHFLIGILTVLVNFWTATYLFCRSQNKRITFRRSIGLVVSSIVLAGACGLLHPYSLQYEQMLSFAVTTLSLALSSGEKQLTRETGIAFIACGFATFFRIFSRLTLLTVTFLTSVQLEDIWRVLIVNTLIVIQAMAMMRIKRFRHGFQFFQQEKNLGLGLFFSGLIFMMSSVDFARGYVPDLIVSALVFGISISGFGMYVWVRTSITEYYKTRQRDKSDSILTSELESLRASNAVLAKLVHRDNHIMHSLFYAIDRRDSCSEEEKKELMHQLRTMVAERSKQIADDMLSEKPLPTTGNAVIDGAISSMQGQAAAERIDFHLRVTTDLSRHIPGTVSQTDLQVLLCDHLKDAIIAVRTRGEPNGSILLNIGERGGILSVTIFDSGVAFTPQTMARLGRERTTTHADNGGNGIGFMTTFETLHRYGASLMITELSDAPFTKSVGFFFDGRNEYIISSPRAEELREQIDRDDATIISPICSSDL